MERSPEQRFEEIHERYLGAVTAYVRRRTMDDDVQDVVADTFLVCWRKLDQVPAAPLPWLYAVARKNLANHYRASARRDAAVPEAPAAAEVQLPTDPVLGVAFARLHEADREVLRLLAWEQLTVSEAAAVIGCSPVACRVRFHRARRRLARQLEELERSGSPETSTRTEPKGATS
jgi:RNA polymerase sigma-70 factor (ECF subfamily)